MKSTYLDTSIILARYLRSDPNFHRVEKLLGNTSQPRYISEASILELYCVFSRLINSRSLISLEEKVGFDQLTTDEKVRVAVEHAIRSWRVKGITPERTSIRLPASDQMFEVTHEIFEAIRCAPELGLKALDALHLAYASTIKEVDPDLDTFTTLDKDISSKKDTIETKTGIRIVVPDG